MRTVVAAMADAGVRRLVALSGAGIHVPGDRKPWPDRVASRVVRRVARHVVGAKQREFDVFSAADIDWTASRPPLVTDGPPQGYRLDLRLKPGVRVRRTDVATALVDQLTDRRFHRAAPFVLPPNGPSLVALGSEQRQVEWAPRPARPREPAPRGRGPSRGRSGHGPGRARTSRQDPAAPWARRTPSGRGGCRPRPASPRIGATPGPGPSSPPAGAAGSAGGPPRPARSRARRRPGGVPGSRRPSRIPTPPTMRSMRPRTATARSRTASRRRRPGARSRRTRARVARATARCRRSTIIPSVDVSDERLARSGAASASNQVDTRSCRIAAVHGPPERLDVGQPARGRMPAAGRGSRTTTSLRRPSISGRAIPAGTGEIRFTQYEESRGVSTGTGIISRRRPRRRAYVRIMSPYERMSGPPISTTPVTSGWSRAPTR